MSLPDRGQVRAFAEDCDGWGMSFVRYARRVVSEVLSVGRGGSLVLWDAASARPSVSLWRAEDILNWEVERIGGRTVLVGLVLRDGERLCVLRLEDGQFVQEVWSGSGDARVMDQREPLRREGVALPFIPFVFHGPNNSLPQVDTGGYVLPGAAASAGQTVLPADLESAAVEQVAAWFQQRDKLGLIRSWPSGGTYMVFSQLPLLPQVAAILRPHRRWTV
jgi:hypothetical protein